MDVSEEVKASYKECVNVAVNSRPLISSELLLGCKDCITVIPGEPQIQIGAHCFTYDHVYGSSATPSYFIFEECVAPLVDAIFHGYNATVLAYGQTGSGKTYTMGTNFDGESNSGGIIPLVMKRIFKKVDEMKKDIEFLIRVSFVEIFKEEVFDLLDTHANAALRIDSNSSLAKPSRTPIQIRETVNGGITLAGVIVAEVTSKEEMELYLMRGSQARATGSTNMNSQSSRSHAIFTICLEQKRSIDCGKNGSAINDFGDDILIAKLHLVDLAGSERAKRTGADGLQLKEGIHINKGLLALGNVINALGDERKRKDGGHVPYRDSKLTRLLQDSLGGNSKTVMIACISPADANAEETINTLKYANRAKNIQNKAVINRDPTSIEMQKLRSQLEQLQSEVLFYRGNSAPFEELQVLRKRVTLLEASNAELHQELKECQITCDQLSKHALDAQVEKDKLILNIEAARNGKSWDEIGCEENTQNLDVLIGYASRIQELETELVRAQNSCNPNQNGFMDCLVVEKDSFLPTLHDLGCIPDGRTMDSNSLGETEDDEREREHSSRQDRLDKELQELDMTLEQKEAEMKRFAKVDTSILKQHYEKKLMELEHEKKDLQNEIEELRFNLANISSTSGDTAQKLKEEYLHKLTMLESQVSELKKRQEAQSQLLRQKQNSDESAKRLQEEIQKIKSQKVQLQQKIKQESEQFRSWKASREKEVLQLKKEGRRNEYEMHKLLALNQRQKMVLQRKTEEASMATKKLKELLEAKKASSREASGNGDLNNPGIKALMQAIEDELEVTVRVYEVRSKYERQVQERAAMARELAQLKGESENARQKILIDCPPTMSPSAKNSRIVTLENMLATSSSTLVFMASQLSEAEERERVFSGKGRWNQVRSLVEAKNLMNHLFNLATLSRCHMWDKEVICREKDSLISELKKDLYRLNCVVRLLEAQKSTPNEMNINLPRKSLRERETGGETEADMDTSDSDDMLEIESDESDEDWVESGKVATKRRPREKKFGAVDENTFIEKDGRICCLCSKYSSCKTKKCKCRVVGESCSDYCSCNVLKCANREDSIPVLDDEKSMELVSQGTLLLQSSLSQKPNVDDSCQRRKPLSDIGNSEVNPKVAKPKKKKNWGKSNIQLVAEPVEPLPPQPNEALGSDEMPLRLPRAMETISLESHPPPPPFTDGNSVRNDESLNRNEENRVAVVPPRSDEKENRIL